MLGPCRAHLRVSWAATYLVYVGEHVLDGHGAEGRYEHAVGQSPVRRVRLRREEAIVHAITDLLQSGDDGLPEPRLVAKVSSARGLLFVVFGIAVVPEKLAGEIPLGTEQVPGSQVWLEFELLKRIQSPTIETLKASGWS